MNWFHVEENENVTIKQTFDKGLKTNNIPPADRSNKTRIIVEFLKE